MVGVELADVERDGDALWFADVDGGEHVRVGGWDGLVRVWATVWDADCLGG
jgi:hypothetical protein